MILSNLFFTLERNKKIKIKKFNIKISHVLLPYTNVMAFSEDPIGIKIIKTMEVKNINLSSVIISLSFLKKNFVKKYIVNGFIKKRVIKKYFIKVKKFILKTFNISKFFKPNS